ncbi:hypothetical protein PHABIO_48 [Pseudomonas phage Phabio]|uniref:Tyrosine specific protein phosphatases domain-containing protein n=1 Tax=Pseudomonas phage Phabio TaxID=2006668 RepID=A0A1Y0SYU1_9CAUD|nr:hypothetical protein MZD05_gp048 [Pseudomonas phage Phabio]ARV76679.1 hypothetical protein PHABIO_48 [Pseudomonas phage Phabio]
MKTVNGRKVSNAEYKRNQAAYHNVGYEFDKQKEKARLDYEEEQRRNPTVIGTSKQWVETFTEPSVVISIGDPGESLPDYACKHKAILRIEIDDVDQEMGPEYTLFDPVHSRRILDFLAKHPGVPIIVHCHAGISRSSAVVKFMVDKLGYKLSGREECTVKGFQTFNRWIYRQLEISHIDTIMQ